MTLRREVARPSQNRVATARFYAGLALAACSITLVIHVVGVAADMASTFGRSKIDIARSSVKTYAYEAYPSWRAAHPEVTCPGRLDVLNEYMSNKDVRDPWGTDYEMFCGVHGIVVHSLGEDALRFSADDIWSR